MGSRCSIKVLDSGFRDLTNSPTNSLIHTLHSLRSPWTSSPLLSAHSSPLCYLLPKRRQSLLRSAKLSASPARLRMRAASTRNVMLSAGNIYDCVYSVSVYCNYSYVGDRRLTRLSVSKKCKSSSFIHIHPLATTWRKRTCNRKSTISRYGFVCFVGAENVFVAIESPDLNRVISKSRAFKWNSLRWYTGDSLIFRTWRVNTDSDTCKMWALTLTYSVTLYLHWTIFALHTVNKPGVNKSIRRWVV